MGSKALLGLSRSATFRPFARQTACRSRDPSTCHTHPSDLSSNILVLRLDPHKTGTQFEWDCACLEFVDGKVR